MVSAEQVRIEGRTQLRQRTKSIRSITLIVQYKSIITVYTLCVLVMVLVVGICAMYKKCVCVCVYSDDLKGLLTVEDIETKKTQVMDEIATIQRNTQVR